MDILKDFIENGDFSGFGRLMDVASFYTDLQGRSGKNHQENIKEVASILLDNTIIKDDEPVDVYNKDFNDVFFEVSYGMVSTNRNDLKKGMLLFIDYADEALKIYGGADDLYTTLQQGQLLAYEQLNRRIIHRLKDFLDDKYNIQND